MRSEQELRKLLAEYRQHEHSYDEEEGGECPVCGDIDQLEYELAAVTGDWSKWGKR